MYHSRWLLCTARCAQQHLTAPLAALCKCGVREQRMWMLERERHAVQSACCAVPGAHRLRNKNSRTKQLCARLFNYQPTTTCYNAIGMRIECCQRTRISSQYSQKVLLVAKTTHTRNTFVCSHCITHMIVLCSGLKQHHQCRHSSSSWDTCCLPCESTNLSNSRRSSRGVRAEQAPF